MNIVQGIDGLIPARGSIKNEKVLDSLPPEVKEKYVDLLNKLTERGFSISLNSANRSFEQQVPLFKSNPAAAVPGNSSHNSGLAIDFNITTPSGKTLTSRDDMNVWIDSGVPKIFETNGFRWGGNFKDNFDPIHVDLVGNQNFTKFDQNENLTPEQKELRKDYMAAEAETKFMTKHLGIERKSKAYVDYRNYYLEIKQCIEKVNLNIEKK